MGEVIFSLPVAKAERPQAMNPSPGGLYGRVVPENFGTSGSTDYRNPLLAQGLKILGFVQRFGMGIEVARRRCADNGNPDPEFVFSPSAVLVTVRKTP